MIRTMKTHRLCSLIIALLVVGCASPTRAQDRSATTGADEVRIALLEAKPRAYAVVEATGSSESSRVRLAGLEAAQHAPDAALPLAQAGLVDENPAVRFAALVTIGKLKITKLADATADLMKDQDPSVRAAAIFAARRCGKDVDLSPLGAMLASTNPSTRANAAMLIGQLGDVQAFDMLQEMAGEPMPRVSLAERTWVRLQFAEAMIRLKPDDAEVLSSIRAAMFSPLDDVRVLSMQILGDVGDRSVIGGLIAVINRENPIQIKLAAAQALAQMGDQRGVKTLVEACGYDSKALEKDLKDYVRNNGGDGSAQAKAVDELLADQALMDRAAAEVRAQAAAGLGWVKTEATAKRLTALLDDPDTIVQVAAASAILRATR